MSYATLTSKGQTTIPQDVRNYLGLHPGDKIEFIIETNGAVVIEPLTVDVSELKAILPKPKKAVTIDAMNKVIANSCLPISRCMECTAWI